VADPLLHKQCRKWVEDNFTDLFPLFPKGLLLFGLHADDEFIAWNAHFPKAVRNANARAWEVIKRTALSDKQLAKSCTIKMFLKSEKYDKADVAYTDESLAPRCISAWQPSATVATGPPIKKFQDYLHKAWGDWRRDQPNTVRNVLFPVGLNSEQLSHWFTLVLGTEGFGGFEAWEDDFTLCDSTHTRLHHDFMLWLYDEAGLFSYPWFEKIRKGQVGPCRGVCRHGVRFVESCTLKSGMSDTCVMNSVWNYIAHMFAIAHTNRIDGVLPTATQLMSKVYMMVLGDDNVTFNDPSISMSQVNVTLNQLGFISKLKKRAVASDVVFLNNWFIEYETGKYRAVPNFLRLLGKIGYATEPQKQPMSYVYEVAQAFQAALSPISLGAAYIEHLMKVSGDRRSPQNLGSNKARTLEPSYNVKRALEWDYKIWASASMRPTQMADNDFCRKAGISPGHLPLLCKAVRSYRSLPCAISHPWLTHAVAANT